MNCIANLLQDKPINFRSEMKGAAVNSAQMIANKGAIYVTDKIFGSTIETTTNYASKTFVGNGAKTFLS